MKKSGPKAAPFHQAETKLLNNLHNSARARIDENHAVIDAGIAVLLHAIRRRDLIVGHTARRQGRADRNVPAIGVGGHALLHDVLAELRLLSLRDATRDRADSGSDGGADRSADNRAANRSSRSAARGAAT